MCFQFVFTQTYSCKLICVIVISPLLYTALRKTCHQLQQCTGMKNLQQTNFCVKLSQKIMNYIGYVSTNGIRIMRMRIMWTSGYCVGYG